MLLSNLGVPDEAFMDLLTSEIAEMGKMFVEEQQACMNLMMVARAQVEHLQPVRFRFTSEPFFRYMMMALYRCILVFLLIFPP